MLAIALPLIDIALRLFGFRRLQGAIDRITPRAGLQPTTPTHLEAGERLASLAAMAGRSIPIFNVSCLRQAIFVYWRLRRRGLGPELMLGVLMRAGQMDAHAWVELDGTALAQPGLAHQAFTTRSTAA